LGGANNGPALGGGFPPLIKRGIAPGSYIHQKGHKTGGAPGGGERWCVEVITRGGGGKILNGGRGGLFYKRGTPKGKKGGPFFWECEEEPPNIFY